MSSAKNEMQGRLAQVYQAQYPARELVEIRDLARISDGWETDVYSFVVEHGPSGARERQPLILRLYPGEDAAPKSAHEFTVMQQLFRCGYPVPRVLVLEQEDGLLGMPFVIMERIEGRPIGAVIDASPHARKLELLGQFTRMYVDLHALDWRPFAPDTTSDEVLDAKALLVGDLAQGRALMHQSQMHDFDPVMDWLREQLPGIRFGRLSVTHGDYHPWNVLLREDGAVFVIDWTSVAVGDYRADLAWTLLLMSTYGSAEPREIVLRHYARFSGREIEQIEFFDVLACLRRLATIVISLGSGADTLGMRPGAEEMMKDVGHIQKVYALLCDRTRLRLAAIEELLSGRS